MLNKLVFGMVAGFILGSIAFNQRALLGWYQINSPLFRIRRFFFPGKIANQNPLFCRALTFPEISEPVDLLFLGDSLTEGGRWKSAFPSKKVINYGVSGDCIQCMNTRLPTFLKVKARKIFLMIGHNDLRKGRTPRMAVAHLRKTIDLVKKLAPESVLYVQSVLPIRNDDIGALKYTDNETIKELNFEIEKLCKTYGVSYIDLFPKFVDEVGSLKKEYSYDGAHITSRAQAVWESVLRDFIS